MSYIEQLFDQTQIHEFILKPETQAALRRYFDAYRLGASADDDDLDLAHPHQNNLDRQTTIARLKFLLAMDYAARHIPQNEVKPEERGQ